MATVASRAGVLFKGFVSLGSARLGWVVTCRMCDVIPTTISWRRYRSPIHDPVLQHSHVRELDDDDGVSAPAAGCCLNADVSFAAGDEVIVDALSAVVSRSTFHQIVAGAAEQPVGGPGAAQGGVAGTAKASSRQSVGDREVAWPRGGSTPQAPAVLINKAEGASSRPAA